MCGPNIITFVIKNVKKNHVKNKKILEVGSLDVNGNIREIIEIHKPKEYIGTDITKGKNVDKIVNVYDLLKTFGQNKYDMIICTEVLEHIQDWRLAILNMLTVLKKGGHLLITSPSIGFPYHGYPHDYWRYEPEDIKYIFGEQKIKIITKKEKGTLAYIQKKENIQPHYIRALWQLKLHSIITGKKERIHNKINYINPNLILKIIPYTILQKLVKTYKKIFGI